MRTERTRMTDKYPLTQRMHWKAMAWLDRNIGGVFGTIFMLFFWMLLAVCLMSPQP